MRTIIKYLSLVAILLISLSRTDAQTIDRDVYTSTLKYFYEEIIENPKATCITLCYRYESVPLVGSSILYELEKLDSALVNSFLYRNGYADNTEYVNQSEFTAFLYSQLDGVSNIHIISEEEETELSRKPTRRNDFWKRLFKKYPCSGGYLFLSHIGYNEDQTEAIFYLENLFHSLAGGGFLAICKLVDGKWCVEKIEAVMQA